MEPESSLPYSQVPDTCPYPQPAPSRLKCPFSFACCAILPLETLPPGDPIGGVVYLRIVFVSRGSISPCKYYFTWVFAGRVVSTSPTPKLEDHPSSAVRDCLFNIFAATLHIGGRSSFRNLRTRHAVVTGTHLSW
jgi:hypothetical protein